MSLLAYPTSTLFKSCLIHGGKILVEQGDLPGYPSVVLRREIRKEFEKALRRQRYSGRDLFCSDETFVFGSVEDPLDGTDEVTAQQRTRHLVVHGAAGDPHGRLLCYNPEINK